MTKTDVVEIEAEAKIEKPAEPEQVSAKSMKVAGECTLASASWIGAHSMNLTDYLSTEHGVPYLSLNSNILPQTQVLSEPLYCKSVTQIQQLWYEGPIEAHSQRF